MEGKEKTPFHLFPFPPQRFYWNLQFFPLTFEVLLYHGSRLLFTHFLPFPWFINYAHTSKCNKSSAPFLSIWFWLKICLFSPPWHYGVVHGHILRAPSRTSEWRTTFGDISRFDPNATPSWWRTQTSRSACLSWNWTQTFLFLLLLLQMWRTCNGLHLIFIYIYIKV
jgi:hypothetical protein